MPRLLTLLLAGLLLPGSLYAPALAAAQESIFEPLILNGLPQLQSGDAAWGDYDGDGDFDLIVTGRRVIFGTGTSRPFTQLYLNEGDYVVETVDADGTPVERPGTRYVDALNPTLPVLEDVWQSAVAWGDYDNDGDLDLLVNGLDELDRPILILYENTGSVDRLARRWVEPGVRAGDVAWGDYDNDGDLDFVVAGTAPADDRPMTALYENRVREGGDFVRRDAGLPGLTFSELEWGDYDADGDLDLLVTGVSVSPGIVNRIYRNDGAGTFSAVADLDVRFFASAAWGDYDADGDLDVLLSGARLTPLVLEGTLAIYRNDAGVFTDVSDGLVGAFENDPTTGRYQGAAAWGDYDGDGYLDFLVTGEDRPAGVDRVQLYANLRNDGFVKVRPERMPGGLFGGAFWGDYDGDGDLDIFVHGEDASEGADLRAFRNPLGSNTPPAAPADLRATPQGTSVVLAWEPAADARTPAPGLTYNLRVGTTPGGVDVASPMANPVTGRRLLSARGNAGHATTRTLVGLAPGTYYWSVQAVDAGYAGSPFAPEGTFTIDG